jgi:formylglycine-generating enzyme required for sulfatase activity
VLTGELQLQGLVVQWIDLSGGVKGGRKVIGSFALGPFVDWIKMNHRMIELLAGCCLLGGLAADETRINSLGVKLVQLPQRQEWMAIHETRVGDYRIFVEATGYVTTSKVFSLLEGRMRKTDASWEAPGFDQDEDHPVTCVSWEDAMAFCDWLTRVERETGGIRPDQSYSLPTDEAWSAAGGIAEQVDRSPQERWESVFSKWGQPLADEETGREANAAHANFAGEEAVVDQWNLLWEVINGWNDGHARTAPVGSFRPNALGLYDLEGNVWEWVFDYYDGRRGHRLVRGGSWMNSDPMTTRVDSRMPLQPNVGYSHSGFRLVLR